MNTKRWIALAIVAVVVVGSLGLIKLFPFWATLACLVSVIAGFAAGYLFKKDIIKEVEKMVTKEVPVEVIKEVVKEVPAVPEVTIPSSGGEVTLDIESSSKSKKKVKKSKSTK